VHPSHPQARSHGYPERLRMAALEFRLAETLGGAGRSRDGVQGRDGAFSMDGYVYDIGVLQSNTGIPDRTLLVLHRGHN